MEKTKQRARMLVYLSRMNNDTETLITNCPPCQKHSHNKQKEPLTKLKTPILPLQQIASDIFDWNEDKYLEAVNYHIFFKDQKLMNMNPRKL
jgi:hypothetical protein